MNELELKEALARIILELDIWCESYHPDCYTDPTISLKEIANRARYSLNKFSRK